MTVIADRVLEIWFGNDLDTPGAVAERSRVWFTADSHFDELIDQEFGTLPERAESGELVGWTEAVRPTLALVIVLDQLPRNLHRGTARSFAYDRRALEVSRAALLRNMDRQVHPLEAAFFYLPFEHAEDLALQAQSVSLFRKLIDRAPPQIYNRFEAFAEYAERHQEVIRRFGRFPHRNSILRRKSTAEELTYLRRGGETFSGTNGNS